MDKRPITPGYVFFYLLFSPDTWRIVMGLVLASCLAPLVARTRELDMGGTLMIWLMLTAIGYSVSAVPGRKISLFLRKTVLKKKED